MKSNSSLTMNRTANDTIVAVIQVLTFFLEDSFIFFCILNLIIVIGSESGDKSNVTYNWSPQKSRSGKRDPRSSRFAKKKFAKHKMWEPLLYSIKRLLSYFQAKMVPPNPVSQIFQLLFYLGLFFNL